MIEEIDCPFCSGKAHLKKENREYDYKGKKVTAETYFYKCNNCTEEFTTTELDTKTLENIHSLNS